MWGKVKNSLWINIMLLTAAAFLTYNAFLMARDAFLLKKEEKARTAEIAKLLKKKEELEAYLEELKTREAVVREAKEKFNLKLPGEEVVVVVPEATSSLPDTRQPASVWEKIKSWISDE